MNGNFTKEQLRQERRLLYQNPVFLVTHEALRPLLRSFDIVELFIFAEQFTLGLLDHPPTEHSLMEYEVNDLKEDLSDDYMGNDIDLDCQLLLMLSLVKLYALRHTHPLARLLSKVLLPFCTEYEGFRELVGKFIVKEQELRNQGKITFQKRKKQPPQASSEPSKLASPDANSPSPVSPLSEARAFVGQLVSNCENLTPNAIEHILVPLMTTNEQYGNAFDEEVDRLKEKLGMKTTSILRPHVEGDLVMEKHVEHEVNGVKEGGSGIIIKKMG